MKITLYTKGVVKCSFYLPLNNMYLLMIIDFPKSSKDIKMSKMPFSVYTSCYVHCIVLYNFELDGLHGYLVDMKK